LTVQSVVLSKPALLLTSPTRLEERLRNREIWKQLRYPGEDQPAVGGASTASKSILHHKLSNTASRESQSIEETAIVTEPGSDSQKALIGKQYRYSIATTKKFAKRGKPVLEISLDNTVQEFSTGKDAAMAANISSTSMYTAIRTGKVISGKRYIYWDEVSSFESAATIRVREVLAAANIQGSIAQNATTITSKSSSLLVGKTEASVFKDGLSIKAGSADKVLKGIRPKRIEQDTGEKNRVEDGRFNVSETGCCLVVYVSGRIFPPDDASEVRGKRRAGGMAIAMPSLSPSFSKVFRQSCEKCFSSQLLSTKNCAYDENGSGFVALLGYPYLRPSRRRCSLYVCREALRVVRQLFLEVSEASKEAQACDYSGGEVCPRASMHIQIVTDSNYVFELLQDTGELLEWGSKPSQRDFAFTGEVEEWTANTDILYPLSRTYFNLVRPDSNVFTAFQTNLTVNFMVDAGVSDARETNRAFLENMGVWASAAAEWQYKRSR
jgi:hypothetical protein